MSETLSFSRKKKKKKSDRRRFLILIPPEALSSGAAHEDCSLSAPAGLRALKSLACVSLSHSLAAVDSLMDAAAEPAERSDCGQRNRRSEPIESCKIFDDDDF